jgi:hypothetical protein
LRAPHCRLRLDELPIAAAQYPFGIGVYGAAHYPSDIGVFCEFIEPAGLDATPFGMRARYQMKNSRSARWTWTRSGATDMLSKSETRLLDQLCDEGEARCETLAHAALARSDFAAAAYLIQLKERYTNLRRDIARGSPAGARRSALRALVEIMNAEILPPRNGISGKGRQS